MANLTKAALREIFDKIRDLLNDLEQLICRQAGKDNGKFDDLRNSGIVKPSNREIKALNAGVKARNALRDKHNATAELAKLKKNKASDKDVIDARKAIYDAEPRIVMEANRAVDLLAEAIDLRANSDTRKAQEAATRKADQTAAREAQEAAASKADQTAARKADQTAAREAQETKDRQAQEAQEAVSKSNLLADDIVSSKIEAKNARIAADEAIEKLKKLRDRDNASKINIDIAMQEVISRIQKAADSEINAIRAENNACLQQEVAPVAEVPTDEVLALDTSHEHDDYPVEYDSEPFVDDDDSLALFNSPKEKLSLVIPETFPLPTPAPTNSSPTDTLSPIKRGDSSAEGTVYNPMSVEQYKAEIDAGIERDRKLRGKYKSELARKDPVATVIAEYIEFLNGREHFPLEHFSVRDITLMRLLSGTWLELETINIYLELLLREHIRFQYISSETIDWDLKGLNRKRDVNESIFATRFHVEDSTKVFLIPVFLNKNHWMLCVATFPEIDKQEGIVTWYNSLHDSVWDDWCEASATDVVRLLFWYGSIFGSRLANISWTLRKGRCGKQNGSDDCGVFVCANVAAIVLDIPLLQNVNGFRRHMASQVVAATKGGQLFLDWSEVKNGLTSKGVVQKKQADVEVEFKDVDVYEDKEEEDDEDIENEEVDNAEMMETDYLCDICCYHYASSQNTLDIHKLEKHNTHPFFCEWPGCYAVMPDQETLDTHYRRIHEREMWVCPIRKCHQRYNTERETLQHLEDEHPEVEHDTPGILDGNFRTYKLADLREYREDAIASWKLSCNSVDEEHKQIGRFYFAYYSATARNYFQERGVLGQDLYADVNEDRTIDRQYARTRSGETRPSDHYALGFEVKGHVSRIHKNYSWWVLFLHQKEGSELDKFVYDALLGGHLFHISHKCHWAFCYVASHLQQVMPPDNVDRNVCKNGTRAKDGGCNALASLHPHDHCKLRLIRAPGFDAELPLPNGRKRRWLGDPTFEAERKKRFRLARPNYIPKSERKGPCAGRGCTTTDINGWRVHPVDQRRVLCGVCYARETKKSKEQAAGAESKEPKSQRKGPCAERGCVATGARGWMVDPDDQHNVLCDKCYRRLLRERKKEGIRRTLIVILRLPAVEAPAQEDDALSLTAKDGSN